MSRLDKFALAKQAAMGTKQTVMEYVLPVESASPSTNRNEMTKEETDGTRFPTDLEYGSRFFEVSASGAARLASLPRVLSGFMGAPTTIAAPGGVALSKKHQFDPVGKVLVPHTMEVDRVDPNPVDIADRYWDAIGNEITLSIEPNDWISFDGSWIARDRDTALITPTGVAVDLSRRLAFHTFLAFISVNGGAETALPCGRFSLNYTNDVNTDQIALGQRALASVDEQNANATVSFVARSALDAHYSRNLLDTDPDNVKIRLIGVGPIIDGTAAYTVEIIAYRCHYTDAPAEIDAGNVLKSLTVSARCALDFTLSKFVDVNVINNVAAY